MMNGRLKQLDDRLDERVDEPEDHRDEQDGQQPGAQRVGPLPRWMPSLRTSAATQSATPLTRTLMPIVLMGLIVARGPRRTTPRHPRAVGAQYSARMSDQVHLRAALRDVPAYKPGKPATAREGATAYKISSNENPYPPLPSVLEVVQRRGRRR